MDASTISSYSVIGVMPSQFSGCCFHDLNSWQGTVFLYPLLVELQFGGNPLADALASDLKSFATA